MANGYYDGTVMRVSRCGDTPTTIASAQGGPWDVAVDATSAYWTNNASGTVMKAPLAGGAPTTLATGQDAPSSITIDSENVYWTTSGDGTEDTFGGVMKVPLGGGTPTTLALGAPDLCAVRGIAVDRTYVYWGDCSLLMSIPLSGGTPTSLASVNAADNRARDRRNERLLGREHDRARTVGKIPLGGGTPVFLGEGDPHGGIAVDSAEHLLGWPRRAVHVPSQEGRRKHSPERPSVS